MTGATHTSRAVDPGRLIDLGKTAADLSASSGISLTEAVVRTVEMEKLNSQQVRRVVESANHEAFSRKYAQTSGRTRAVHFDDGPADPTVVLAALKTASSPRAVPVSTADYDLPPTFHKSAALAPEPIFRTKAGAYAGILDLQHQLNHAHEEAVAGAEVAKVAMREAMAGLRDHVGHAVRSGASADDIVAGWSAFNADIAKIAAERLGLRLLGVKTAGVVLNPQHAVMTTFVNFCEATEGFQAWESARGQVESELMKVSSWLKERAA